MCRHNNNKRNRSEDLEHLEIQLALARIEDKLDELEEKLEDIHEDIEGEEFGEECPACEEETECRCR